MENQIAYNKQKLIHEIIDTPKNNICELAVIKEGKLLYEDYWNGYQAGDTLHVASVTKSITSLLIGIAQDKHMIKDIRQPVLDFFPDYKIRRGEKTIQKVTIEHLLTMTAPYKCKFEPWSKVCSSDDWTVAALNILGGRTGITGEFKYSTLGIHILMGIIANASGMKTIEFANKYLFEPLQISNYTNYIAQTAEEHKSFIISKKPKEKIWFSDLMDVNSAGFGLCMSAVDMAKIGQLCLGNGTYLDRKIISSEWITESTKARYQCDERFGNMSYGYLWWIVDEKKHIYAASGTGGNVIYINPEKNLTIAVASTFNPRIFDRIQFIQNRIEPLVLNHQSI